MIRQGPQGKYNYQTVDGGGSLSSASYGSNKTWHVHECSHVLFVFCLDAFP